MKIQVILLASLVALASLAQLGAQRGDAAVRFSMATQAAGITFKHENGASAEKHLPETMGGGAIVLDFDNDGWPDLFFVNGGSLVDKRVAAEAGHRLYRNKGDGTFADVTASSGIKLSGYGMGACSADYDNDGWADLYVTAFGSNRLYRNTGKGTFTDVTEKATVSGGGWSTSCSFADVDNDGFLDLYAARYVDFTVAGAKRCNITENVRSYCHPTVYRGVPDLLYHNSGDGTFADISDRVNVPAEPGNGLGVVFGDVDDDGWPDAYVANDSTPSFLFRNKGAGKFEEIGFRAGVALGREGMAMAGMGTDMGDVDGSGRLSIIATNLDRQAHSLYRNLGQLLFADATFSSGLGEATLRYVGFGAVFFDFDNDGDLDLSIANGDVLDNVSVFRDARTYEQPRLLLENDGAGKFKSIGASAGPAFAPKRVGRALAYADIDNDGDLDLVAANAGQTADLLRNESGNRANSLLVRTIGTKSNRDGIGARLKLFVGNRVLLRYVKAGSSYLAQNDLRAHFGLGGAPRAERLEIRWPSGAIETFTDLGANQILTLKEGSGIETRRPFKGREQ